MRSQTKADIIDAGGKLATTLVKELVSSRQERNLLEKQAEYEKELAAARAGTETASTPSSNEDESGGPLTQAAEISEELARLFDQAKGEQDCQLCRKVIEEAETLPVEKQAEVLPKLQQFIDSVGAGDSKHEIANRLRQHPELVDLLAAATGQDQVSI